MNNNILLSDLISEGPSRSNPNLGHETAKLSMQSKILIELVFPGFFKRLPKHATKGQMLNEAGGDISLEELTRKAKMTKDERQQRNIDELVQAIREQVENMGGED